MGQFAEACVAALVGTITPMLKPLTLSGCWAPGGAGDCSDSVPPESVTRPEPSEPVLPAITRAAGLLIVKPPENVPA